MEKRTILITGGLGLIGHNVVARLERQGHSVIITDTQTNYGLVPQDELDHLMAERRKKISTDRIFKIDIADRDGMDWLVGKHQPDTIIHMASFPRQKVVNANPQLGSRAMSEGLLNLLEASKKHNVCKFVYISSSMVYGDFTDQVREDAKCCPQGQYGIMKLAGEWLVKDYTRSSGIAHTIIRPSAVYGPLDVEDRVIAKFMLTAMRGGVLKVNGAGETLDFTYVDDAADGIVAAALSSNTNNKTYNITKSHSRSLLDAAELAVKIVGKGTIEVRDKDADFPSRGALNIDAARKDFNFYPTVDVEEGFQAYYEWLNNSVYWSKKTV
ncbi:WcaG Nucleoside-diphosphate-sugar epimerases [uncultured Caudovirales phage]|uniref:WcaG Nucleoside-diphosphate-sugar epimerases n=1 Tax=uncultured Caudovirales phage TaxID=2100421 RepID=A0A6J5LU66_9CAUD|nr:WcaG Nucleoside-diphosphate-sugar epimerases [uncultured Caudovirales phage]